MVNARFAAFSLALLAILFARSLGTETVEYLRDVKPILKERCFACHGALKQQAGLRLDTANSVRRGGENGQVIIAGKPAESRLMERVSAVDLTVRMPPEGKPLTAEQIAILMAWIEQGGVSPEQESPEADPREHWAF